MAGVPGAGSHRRAGEAAFVSAPAARAAGARQRAWAGLAAILLLAGAAYAVDVRTKTWAEEALAFRQPVPIVGDLFRLTLGYNTGVAFGLFAGGGATILALSGAIILGVLAWITAALRTGEQSPRLWPLGLILGGATANLADRLPDGRVTDFLDAGIGTARWPTFNLADTAIVVGIALLLLAVSRAEPTPARERG